MVVQKIILLFLLGWEVAANLSGSSSGHAIFAITYRGAVKELIFQVDRNAKAISPPPSSPLKALLQMVYNAKTFSLCWNMYTQLNEKVFL